MIDEFPVSGLDLVAPFYLTFLCFKIDFIAAQQRRVGNLSARPLHLNSDSLAALNGNQE
jgi:hypothetical protein